MSCPEIGIYVHWPYCLSKCPYCDFNSHAAGRIPEELWRGAIIKELHFFRTVAPGRRIESVYFGGGTPSLMAPRSVAKVLDAIQRLWPCDPNWEVTIEANPSTAEATRFRAYREAGVSRISIGVQSFADQALHFLGRTHSAAEARAAIECGQRIFPRFSFDLIYGWLGHTGRDWQKQLEEALSLAPEHLSIYQLTIEPGTPFAERGCRAVEENLAADLFEIAQEVLESAALPAYEISNHAAPESRCRHNLSVWRGSEYIGVGPGAHGRLVLGTRPHALRSETDPDTWMARVEQEGSGVAEVTPLTTRQRAEELVLTGLRLAVGIDKALFQSKVGLVPEDVCDPETLFWLQDEGLLEVSPTTFRATSSGRRNLDAVLSVLLA
jgi:oxygen-independent coproporphyrinogen-3 oxidase